MFNLLTSFSGFSAAAGRVKRLTILVIVHLQLIIH